MTVRTSYLPTDEQLKGGMNQEVIMPLRACSYMVSLLQTWFGNPDNITNSQMKTILFKAGRKPEDLHESKVEISVEYPDDLRISDKLPRVCVYSTQLQVATRNCLNQVNEVLQGRQVKGIKRVDDISYDLQIEIRSPGYVITENLASMLFLYLNANSTLIKQDAGLSSFSVAGMKVTKLSQEPGGSKDVFTATIVCKAADTATVVVDTVGPVLNSVGRASREKQVTF